MTADPEEKTYVLRKLQPILYSHADFEWRVESNGKCISVEPKVLKYSLGEGSDICYRSDKKHFTSTKAVRELCDSLCREIGCVEGSVLKKKELEWAASCIDTLLIREEFMIGPADPSRLFKKRCDTIRRTYDAFHDELQKFPIEIFSSCDFFGPKEKLAAAKQMLLEIASTYQGKTVHIRNIRQFTEGFVRDNCLLFDPLDEYCTENSQSAYFRVQLQKHATAL